MPNLRQLMEEKFDPTDAGAAGELAYLCLRIMPHMLRAAQSQDNRMLIGRDGARELSVGVMELAEALKLLPSQARGIEVDQLRAELLQQPVESLGVSRRFDDEIRAAVGQAMGLAKPGTAEPAKGDWPPLESLLNVIRDLVTLRRQLGPRKYPLPCHLCNHQIEDESDLIWHGLGNCAELCSRCTGSGEEPKIERTPGPTCPIHTFVLFADCETCNPAAKTGEKP